MKQILLIPNIEIHNANALSSPYTIGFPAMTAWLGWMHHIQRQLRQKLASDLSEQEISAIAFKGICVSCHDIHLHTHKDTYRSYIIGTSNPLVKKDGSVKRPSFVEEARASLKVSIAIELEEHIPWGEGMWEKIEPVLQQTIYQNKIASGDVIRYNDSKISRIKIDESDDTELNKLLLPLMPGYCLVSRQDLLQHKMQQGQSALSAIVDFMTVVTELDKEQGKDMKRNVHKKEQQKGWLVPIPIGYQGLTEAQKTNVSRDEKTPHLFAESVLTLGEFIMPTRFENIEQLFWYYSENTPDNDLYLCQNNYYKHLT